MTTTTAPERLHSLDGLRGIAALAVVLWHWQHFFFTGARPGAVDLSSLPLAQVLHPFYTHGYLAVDLFFALSGFVFHFLYERRVASQDIDGWRFGLLRFSRLYPLHLVTLVMVAILQLMMLRMHGQFFVYPNNDSWSFLLNLCMASSWGLENGYSFNGPAWSVSVEVLLYVMFFIGCRLGMTRAPMLLGMIVLGLFISWKIYLPLGRGIASFYVGGLACIVYRRILAGNDARGSTMQIAWAATAAWLATLLLSLADAVMPSLTQEWSNRLSAALGMPAAASVAVWAVLVLFPLTILACALLEKQRVLSGNRTLTHLGQVSYASYLLHFPLQLCIALTALQWKWQAGIFYSPWLMLGFILTLLFMSSLSYRWLEMPMQAHLRRVFSPSPVGSWQSH
jgi:peptidoglycan/LPS O-acetylase OafA/YrhL